MYFPFFTCEVKCSARSLRVADNQNAHGMTLAVRGVARPGDTRFLDFPRSSDG
jgi:hypothetical protein